MERLQKVLANSNVASRRKSEELILAKRVSVNDEVVTELGTKVKRNDVIRVDGKIVERTEKIYLLVNKPIGYVSSTDDEKNRKVVTDIVVDDYPDVRLYPAGRLDYDSSGLIIVTNDGELTKILTHPKFSVEKEYNVRVEGMLNRNKVLRLKKGVIIDDNYLSIPKEVIISDIDKATQTTLLKITLTEGKNRQIRKMMENFGHPVKTLTRIRYDFLTIEGVKKGGYRPLTVHEVKKLYSNKYTSTK